MVSWQPMEAFTVYGRWPSMTVITREDEGLGHLLDRWQREDEAGEDFYSSLEWREAKACWLPHVEFQQCYFCFLPFPVCGTIVPHHLSLSLGDSGYLPLQGNPDVVPCHPECHAEHHGRIDLGDWKKARHITIKRIGEGFKNAMVERPVLCLDCGLYVVGKRPLGGENRCKTCFNEHKRRVGECGECWNCGWHATGEYRGEEGLCSLCISVRNDPKLFKQQRREREGLL